MWRQSIASAGISGGPTAREALRRDGSGAQPSGSRHPDGFTGGGGEVGLSTGTGPREPRSWRDQIMLCIFSFQGFPT